MPKIIKDLRPQIKNTALKEFEDIGFEAVTMRKLASKVGIGVGTLYNYFSNKEELYEEILIESWQVTYDKLQAHYGDQSLKKIIEILYDDIVDRKGLGGYILKFDVNETAIDTPLKKLLHQTIESLIEYFKENNMKYPRRKATSLIIGIANIVKTYPDERDINIEYYCHLIKE